jgi:hypothetical protein
MTCVDEFTRKIWIYLLKEKSEVFNEFKKFCALVERQCGNHLKILRTDGGGEYNSNDFKLFCEEKGLWQDVCLRVKSYQRSYGVKLSTLLLMC